MELKTHYKSDSWGQLGEKSLAGWLAWQNSGMRFKLEGPYSELIAATHRAFPTIVKSQVEGGKAKDRETLRHILKMNPDLLGDNKESRIGGMPFIYKVISVRMATPIWCHPRKEDNKILRKMCPNQFVNRVAKEIMMISVGYSLLYFGIRPRKEIKLFLKRIPEMTCFLHDDNVDGFIKRKNPMISNILFDLFHAKEHEVQLAINALILRIKEIHESCPALLRKHALEYFLFLDTIKVLPNNTRAFLPFFFNCVILGPGESIHIPPGTPYSFMYGNCICISTKSTNTVEVGRVSCLYDIQLFLKIANLSPPNIKECIVNPEHIDLCIKKYKPLHSNLAIDCISVPENLKQELTEYKNCSILHVVKGHIHTSDFRELKAGGIFFLSGDDVFYFKAKEDSVIYRAYYEMEE